MNSINLMILGLNTLKQLAHKIGMSFHRICFLEESKAHCVVGNTHIRVYKGAPTIAHVKMVNNAKRPLSLRKPPHILSLNQILLFLQSGEELKSLVPCTRKETR